LSSSIPTCPACRFSNHCRKYPGRRTPAVQAASQTGFRKNAHAAFSAPAIRRCPRKHQQKRCYRSFRPRENCSGNVFPFCGGLPSLHAFPLQKRTQHNSFHSHPCGRRFAACFFLPFPVGEISGAHLSNKNSQLLSAPLFPLTLLFGYRGIFLRAPINPAHFWHNPQAHPAAAKTPT